MKFYDKQGDVCSNYIDRILTNIGIDLDAAERKRRTRIIDRALHDMEPYIQEAATQPMSEQTMARHVARLVHTVNYHNDSSNIRYDGPLIYEEAINRFIRSITVRRLTQESVNNIRTEEVRLVKEGSDHGTTEEA